MVIISLVVVIVLISLSGLFSGLTLGLMSLDTFVLRRKVRMGNKDAAKIYPLRKQGNLLLCTLLLGNVAVNAALSIFLGSLTAGVIAGFIATALIVIFGEILPQAFFARHALKFGARTTWLVWVFLIILYPATKPIALLLDKLLGNELPKTYTKRELHLVLDEQKNLKNSEIDKDDYEILRKGLYFSEKQAKDIMTPTRNVFTLNKRTELNDTMLNKIHESGHSRIPVFDRKKERIVGTLFTKDLITLDPEAGVTVEKLMRHRVLHVKPNLPLNKILRQFQQKKMHIAIVREKQQQMKGIVTLEDVLEEIIGEVVDEHDRFKDMRHPHAHQ